MNFAVELNLDVNLDCAGTNIKHNHSEFQIRNVHN